jgi:hypothetical protein
MTEFTLVSTLADLDTLDETERVGSKEAASILGVSLRTVQIQSAAGKVPSAARPFGTWTYDPVVLRRFVKELEARACQTTSIDAARSGGDGFSVAGPSIDEAYARLIRQRRAAGSKRGGKTSRTRPSTARPAIHIVRP